MEYLIKIKKIETVWSGLSLVDVTPRFGVNHVKLVVSLYYYVVLVYFFCLLDDDDYECSTNVSIGEKITKFFIFADYLNALYL